MGLYYDEFNEGDEWTSSSRTITEADIVNFACLTGDFNPLHTDEEWCKANSPFRTRIAHGLLTLSYANGLVDQLSLLKGTVMAFLGSEFKLPVPVMAGDTITAKQKVVGKRDTSKPDRGVMSISIVATNQRDEVVLENKVSVMVARKMQNQST